MANSKGFAVLVDELTVHQATRELNHPITGEKMGFQQGNGGTWFLDEVIPAEALNPEWVEALEKGEGSLYESLKDKLAPSNEEPTLSDAVRMGAPFEGYDEMDEDDILLTMRVLPSATVLRIIEWEKAHENRPEIVGFDIGFGVSPSAYQEGKVPGGDASMEGDETKAVRAIRTREIPEDGPVIPGEGITGTGDPAVEPGTAAAEEENGGTKRKAPKRRAGRRPRPSSGDSATTGDSTTKSGDGS